METIDLYIFFPTDFWQVALKYVVLTNKFSEKWKQSGPNL